MLGVANCSLRDVLRLSARTSVGSLLLLIVWIHSQDTPVVLNSLLCSSTDFLCLPMLSLLLMDDWSLFSDFSCSAETAMNFAHLLNF